MRYYFLAFVIWILEIVMFATIILIPVAMYLRDSYVWFDAPFGQAGYASWWR